jgi:hypothetical protein
LGLAGGWLGVGGLGVGGLGVKGLGVEWVTEEEDSEYFSNYLWLFRTRMPMLRRQELL